MTNEQEQAYQAAFLAAQTVQERQAVIEQYFPGNPFAGPVALLAQGLVDMVDAFKTYLEAAPTPPPGPRPSRN